MDYEYNKLANFQQFKIHNKSFWNKGVEKKFSTPFPTSRNYLIL